MAKIRLLGQGRTLTAKALLVEMVCDCGKTHIIEVATMGNRLNLQLMRKDMKVIDQVEKKISYRPDPVV